MQSAAIVLSANLENPTHAAAIVDLLNQYAQHPMGQSEALPDSVQETLIVGLRDQAGAKVFLACQDDQFVGLATCFVGFSTFKARPLMNIHDLFVVDAARGQGIGRQLIAAVRELAREAGYCAITLEVRADNPARALYRSEGFESLEDTSDRMCFGKLPLV